MLDESVRRCFAASAALRALFQTWRSPNRLGGQPRQHPFDRRAVDIVAAQMRIAVGRENLEDAPLMLRIEMSKVPPPKS